jgi:hypothetical protein
MAPGLLAAVERAELVAGGFVQHNWASSTTVHEWYVGEIRKLVDAIRAVTPPPATPATPEEGDRG